MNGDEKGEAHRPRPLSAGIWTLFSWLRRSERSSSSESVSSVGSARTTVSFDFLAPGNYNFANKPIVLTTPLNPPSETYKKRLHERNLRRQRDRDVTLHRKYGLFREYGNGYDGFTLPLTRRSTLDRPNRERRATSETLQRRAAYVPGKRRAPLPPATVISASLPRNYKRKRPAPKPPTKNTIKDNHNIAQLIENPVRMTSNSESEDKIVSDNELLNSTQIQKCDKKGTISKDTKTRTEKNFLKHIFENKKRSSVIESSSVRLLPSISELDKQATEIIERNKLREKTNNVKVNDMNTSHNKSAFYEANSWFCTSCLRKYNSSIHTCNYCLLDKRKSNIISPRSSISTQTKINGETSISSPNNIDERKVLKKILKEMKDSLPKKSKNDNVNNILTEIPTLRIGSTVQEEYKDFTSQPSTSNEIQHSKRFPVLSQLSDTQRNNNIEQRILSGANLDSSENTNPSPFLISSKGTEKKDEGIISTNVAEENNVNTKIYVKDIDKINIATKSTDNNKLQLTPTTSHTTLQDDRHSSYILKEKFQETSISNGPNQVSSTSAIGNISAPSDKKISKSSKLQFLNFPNSHAVVVNTVTVVSTHKNTENNSITSNSSNALNKNEITINQFQKPFNKNVSPDKNVKIKSQNDLQTRATVAKSETSSAKVRTEYNLHTPLKISSLLNPTDSTNKSIVKKTISLETQADKHFQNKLSESFITSPKTFGDKMGDSNKAVVEKDIPLGSDIKKIYLHKKTPEPQAKVLTETQSSDKTVTTKDNLHEQKPLASTSRCFSNSNNHTDNLAHYDRRRQLINQLEQSIAKGDEVAAAEAAVKLAKLRLSCSVLSFSSQIIGETSNGEKHEKENTKVTTSVDKTLEQGIALDQKSQKDEQVNTNSQLKETDPVQKSLQNKKPSDKVVCKLSKESNVKPQELTSESSTSKRVTLEDIVPINVWIEDKQAARGPIRLEISRAATMADLRKQAEDSLGLATRLQRWIVGRTLCSDDTSLLISLAGPDLTAPFYLCIVQPDQNEKPVTTEDVTNNKDSATGQNGEFYTELMNLEKQSLVPNVEPFECGVCIEECAVGAGVVLRECIHTFCKECLSDVVQHSQEPAVACPAMGCSGFLQEREIRSIVSPEEYERWLARGLATAECGTRNAFHCRTRDCTGWAFCDPGVRRFPCPVCKNTNCVQCKTIHEGETCEEYQTKLRQAVTAAETNKDDEGTKALLDSLISRGEALECPECRAIITKKWGCDWVKCSACKTEICWITKGRRWGPGGRGDTSGGCRCGVDGQRCHPSCGYCH